MSGKFKLILVLAALVLIGATVFADAPSITINTAAGTDSNRIFKANFITIDFNWFDANAVSPSLNDANYLDVNIVICLNIILCCKHSDVKVIMYM